jgi:ppGpp synthetase/RelA/SpoT-type nucleotidyltranferase
MSELNTDEYRQWYEAQRPTYLSLANTVKNTLETLMRNAGIDFLSVTTRAKEIDSFVEKIGRKIYQNPAKDITDLAGIRIITFIESDALKVNELIKDSFNVDDAKSLDKSSELGTDKLGYRSFHFVCDLGEKRHALPEFKVFKDLVFEVQVRTVLGHAWAEIEHDRNYKFAGVLPSHLQRKLRLLSGLLELADGEFDRLAGEIDKYSEEVSQKSRQGDLNIELNTISFYQYLQNLKKRINFDIELMESKTALAKTVGELYLFGIETIAQLDELFSSDFLKEIHKYKHFKYLSLPYLASEAMMYADIERYFECVHVRNTIAVDKETADSLVAKYGGEKVDLLFEANGLSILDWDTKEFIFGKLKGNRLHTSANPDKT